MTFAGMAAELSAAIGQPIRHMPITFEAFHANNARSGGTFVADVLAAIARETLDGCNARLADGVSRAPGQPPRDFSEFARAAARSGAWTSAA